MGVGGDDSEMRFMQGDESGGNGSMRCPSSGVEMTTSMALFPKPDPFFSSADWDPIVPAMVSNNGFSNFQYCSLPMEYQGMNSFAGYPSASGSSCFRMEPNQIIPRKDIGSEEAIAASFNRKRRKPDIESESNPSLNWNKKAVEELQNDAAKDQSSKKSDFEQNPGANSNGKQPSKETTEKENSQSGEAPKENYIHMRARKGQATNSHSLAERVRREKISERMRLLQELVPGCNKITGKAVMLDEIINYVQSLQQQVEFLSMKLATVNPEMNFDIERIMSKDILSSRGGNATVLGFSPAISHSHHPYAVVQGTIPNMPSTNQHFTHLPQTVVDNELQGLYQMGLLPASTMDGLAPNGRLKPEL